MKQRGTYKEPEELLGKSEEQAGQDRSKDLGEELEKRERDQTLSQWQLMFRAFKRHKLAVAAVIVLGMLYIVAIASGFFAPQDPHTRSSRHVLAPPQRIHFRDAEGRFHLRPFVYELIQEMDPDTWARIYAEDTSRRYPIYFLTRGDEYKLMGLLKTDVHLFGTRQGTPFFLLGSDDLGRDVLSRVIYGTRISLSIGLIGVLLSLVLGLLLGGAAGLLGGVVDKVIQRITEVLISIPRIPLWMALAAALPQNWPALKTYFAITMLLSLIGWIQVARVVRGKFLSLRNEDFVLAVKAMGASNAWIIVRHLIPNFMSYVLVQVTLAIPWMIIAETSLSFLGLGLRPPVISWGVMLKQAQNMRTVSTHPWLLIPALFVIIAVLMFNFVGDGLRDAADPYKG